MKHPQEKGKRAEREWIALVTHHLGGTGKRTPNSGGLDIKSDVRFWGNALADWHHEVKHQERLSVLAWIRQAQRDAGLKLWCIPFRTNQTGFRVVLDAADFLNLVAELQELRGKGSG
jgi:hypothetical protein